MPNFYEEKMEQNCLIGLFFLLISYFSKNPFLTSFNQRLKFILSPDPFINKQSNSNNYNLKNFHFTNNLYKLWVSAVESLSLSLLLSSQLSYSSSLVPPSKTPVTNKSASSDTPKSTMTPQPGVRINVLATSPVRKSPTFPALVPPKPFPELPMTLTPLA